MSLLKIPFLQKQSTKLSLQKCRIYFCESIDILFAFLDKQIKSYEFYKFKHSKTFSGIYLNKHSHVACSDWTVPLHADRPTWSVGFKSDPVAQINGYRFALDLILSL